MIRPVAIAVLLLLSFHVHASDQVLPDKEQLKLLLKERKDHFDGYMQSLQTKTGLFGGKSKKDLHKSQEILVEIVRLDNRMISILNRQLDFKNFEKTEMTYRSVQDYEQQDRLALELSATRKELAKLKSAESSHRLHLRLRNTVIFLLLTAFLVMHLLPRYLKRKKEASLDKENTALPS